MRRAFAIPLVLLQFGGIAVFVLGVMRMQWREYVWSLGEERKVAEALCRPDEKFTTWPVRKGVTWGCVDASGRRRNIMDALLALSPSRQLANWGPTLGGLVAFVGGFLATGFALRQPRRRVPRRR